MEEQETRLDKGREYVESLQADLEEAQREIADLKVGLKSGSKFKRENAVVAGI